MPNQWEEAKGLPVILQESKALKKTQGNRGWKIENRRMANILKAWRAKWAAREVLARKKLWDNEYASGFGEQLKLPGEAEHHCMLVEFLVKAGKNKKILDVGCGEGLILDYLKDYESYLGVDFSEVALRAASRRADAKTAFVQAEAESFVPAREFDAIIFNESLYYFKEPLKVAAHYEKFLQSDGVLAVSIFMKTNNVRRLAADLAKRYEVLREESIQNERGSWQCLVLRAKDSRR
jgi:SAM-dependent methyltransferase